MRELTHNELSAVSAGELTCTIGLVNAISCTGTLKDWKQAYNDAVGAVTDLFESWFG
jgi:hypothetical protein